MTPLEVVGRVPDTSQTMTAPVGVRTRPHLFPCGDTCPVASVAVMGNRIKHLISLGRVLVPHIWKLALAAVGLVVAVVGFAVDGFGVDSVAGWLGIVLAVASVGALVSDAKEVRSRLDSLYQQEVSPDLHRIRFSPPYDKWERIDVAPIGLAITDNATNQALRNADDLPVQVLTEPYRPPPSVEWAQAHSLVEGRRRQQRDFDDPKVRLCSDLPTPPSALAFVVQRTRYSYSSITNELVTHEFRSRNPEFPGLVAEDVALPDGVLPTLGRSECSNHIGVDTLGVTRNDELVLVVQSTRNAHGGGQLAPSGSGSADWADLTDAVAAGTGMGGFLRGAMERELSEECGLLPAQVKRTELLGFARFVQRGGKPQFCGVTRLSATRDDLRRLGPDRVFVDDYVVHQLDLADSARAAATVRAARTAHSGKVSVPLAVNLELLARWIEQDPDALGWLRAEP